LFVLQLSSGIGSLFDTSDTGGVAYMAHIGGFVAGLVLAFLFRGKPKPATSAAHTRARYKKDFEEKTDSDKKRFRETK